MTPALPDTWSRRPVFGGILVGGASRRMQRPKTEVRLAGVTFLERVLAAVQGHVERVVLLGNAQASVNGLVEASARTPGLNSRTEPWCTLNPPIVRLPDVPDVTGPLAGILAALRWARHACWLISACDLPLVRKEAIEWLLGERGPERYAVLPSIVPGRVEPLLAIYEPESRMLLERLVARGLDAPHCLAGEPNVHSPIPPEPLQICWTNVNTPEELRRIGLGMTSGFTPARAGRRQPSGSASHEPKRRGGH